MHPGDGLAFARVDHPLLEHVGDAGPERLPHPETGEDQDADEHGQSDPAGYVDLLRTAYTNAKRADPNVYVLSAPLAVTLGEPHPEPNKWRAMSDLQARAHITCELLTRHTWQGEVIAIAWPLAS